jgi:hypothetical protein
MTSWLTCKRSLVRVQVRPPIFSLVHARIFRVSNTAIRRALDRHGPIGGPLDWVDSRRRRGSVAPRRRDREAHTKSSGDSLTISPKCGWNDMETCGQAIVKARKAVGLTQKVVAERLRREDDRKVLPPFLNDLEHDRRHPPEDAVEAAYNAFRKVIDEAKCAAVGSETPGEDR